MIAFWGRDGKVFIPKEVLVFLVQTTVVVFRHVPISKTILTASGTAFPSFAHFGSATMLRIATATTDAGGSSASTLNNTAEKFGQRIARDANAEQ